MLFLILSVVVLVTIIIKSYQYYHRHCYMNFEQFNQYYCQPFTSSIYKDENFSPSTIDMFHKCENNNKYHIKSNVDYLCVCKYIQEFLCQNSEYINRPGSVCPFVPSALKQNLIYFLIANDQYNNKERLIKMIQQCRYDFVYKLKPIDGNRHKLVYKCLIILIRSSDISHSLIEEIQTELKPTFVLQDGLMFGQFDQSANSTAIRNEDFHPFRTYVPLLVIRYMTATDIIFLKQKHKYSVEIRRNMINKYLSLYHSGLLYRSKTDHLQSANEILEELNSTIN